MKKYPLKRLILLTSFAIIFYCFSQATAYIPDYPHVTQQYLSENAAIDGNSLNWVTSILLHYRFFDCVFVLTILFIASNAIFFMGKKDADRR